MDDTIFLADEIRDKLDAGLLPLMLPERIWGGCGHGDTCSACDRVVHPAQLEYWFRAQQDSDKPLRFHFACLGLWLAQLRRRGIEVGREVVQVDDGRAPMVPHPDLDSLTG
jgi:hypothetical protein